MTAQTCTHRPPSPGQSMCQCQHQQREMEFGDAIAARAGAERLARLRMWLAWACLVLPVTAAGVIVALVIAGVVR